jgi:flavin reductase (DIM6/NTAB) family NADH-FMN oxidoreductase RutF
MNLKNRIKQILSGLTVPQEYVCLNSHELQYPLSVFLSSKNKKLNVTSLHLFLGYKPLILALTFKVNDKDYQEVKNQNQITLDFENPKPITPTCLARVELKKIDEKILNEDVILFYEGINGEHYFVSSFHQWINRQREKWYKEIPNNVSLPGNLVDQVRIAYSLPRSISIIAMSDGNLMNMFPTDLHGPIGDKFYAGSLRVGGLANDQVEKYQAIVISEVESSFYKQTYSLGKNHMQNLRRENEFALHTVRSKTFNFPLPAAVISYRELKRINSVDVGIHRIHIYEVLHRQVIQNNKTSLTHIHQYYAQWRIDHGLATDMLFR